MLLDAFGRRVEYVRVSVTDRCNLRCRYCMPEEGVRLQAHADILRFEEIEAFARVAVRLGIRCIRITGGEPLVKRGVERLVRMLASIPSLDDLAMTTNGLLLATMASRLKEAGLRRVNIGLPSLEPKAYALATRCAEDMAAQAIRGVHAAVNAGLHPVKINVVVMKGINDEPEPFVRLTTQLPVHVRFIEYMPMGPDEMHDSFVPASTIEKQIRVLAGRRLEPVPAAEGSGPAQRAFRVGDSPGTLAIIAPLSDHFCHRCNRLRLTADGHLKPCLFADNEIDLKPALRPQVDDQRIQALLEEATHAKPGCIPTQPHRGRRLMGQVGG